MASPFTNAAAAVCQSAILTRSCKRRGHTTGGREDGIEICKKSPSSPGLVKTSKRLLRHTTDRDIPADSSHKHGCPDTKRHRTSIPSATKRLRSTGPSKTTQDSLPLPDSPGKKSSSLKKSPDVKKYRGHQSGRRSSRRHTPRMKISDVTLDPLPAVANPDHTHADLDHTHTSPDHAHITSPDHTHISSDYICTHFKSDPDSPLLGSSSTFEDPLPFHLPGRSNQIRQLLHLLKNGSSKVAPPCVYLHGASSTGKSLTIKTVLSYLKVPMAIFHSRECCSREIFFTDVLNQLTGVIPTRGNNYLGRGKCGNISLFVDRLSRILSEQINSATPTTCALVVEDVELLYGQDPLLIQGLLSVPQLVKGHLTLVLTSRLSPELLLDGGVMVTGITQEIYFPTYTKEEVLDILSLERPSGVSHTSYHTFLVYTWKALQAMSNNLMELCHLSGSLFSQYTESVKDEHSSGLKMWYDLQPSIRAVLDGQPLTNFHPKDDYCRCGGSVQVGSVPDTVGNDEFRMFPELPHISKYLLLASFLASNNPANTDKQYFSNLKKRRYRKSKKTATQQHSHLVKGPGLFVLDRMLAIFYCISDTSVLSEAQLSSQLSTLVTVQYLSHVNKEEVLDCPRRYRCKLSLDEALHVASTVGFDLLHHLHQLDQ